MVARPLSRALFLSLWLACGFLVDSLLCCSVISLFRCCTGFFNLCLLPSVRVLSSAGCFSTPP